MGRRAQGGGGAPQRLGDLSTIVENPGYPGPPSNTLAWTPDDGEAIAALDQHTSVLAKVTSAQWLLARDPEEPSPTDTLQAAVWRFEAGAPTTLLALSAPVLVADLPPTTPELITFPFPGQQLGGPGTVDCCFGLVANGSPSILVGRSAQPSGPDYTLGETTAGAWTPTTDTSRLTFRYQGALIPS